MKKFLNICVKLFTWLLVAFTVFMMVFTIFTVTTVDRNKRDVFGYKFYIVRTNSMSLSEKNQHLDIHFDAGDIVVVKNPEDPRALQPGQVISFMSTNEVSYGETVTHMIRSVKKTDDGRVLGYAYGSAPFARAAYGWCAEDSIYLLPEAQGRGIGSRLCLALEKVLFYQGYQRIYALITAENKHSMAFHEKLGYTLRGTLPDAGIKFGRRVGVVWMDKAANFVDIPSSFPRSWNAIMQDSQTFSDILDILSLF